MDRFYDIQSFIFVRKHGLISFVPREMTSEEDIELKQVGMIGATKKEVGQNGRTLTQGLPGVSKPKRKRPRFATEVRLRRFYLRSYYMSK